MINKEGGSSHDPEVRLPPPMWDRPMKMTGIRCRACADRSLGSINSPMLEVPRAFTDPVEASSVALAAAVGALGPLALVCRRCDSPSSVPV